jgi:hypothetical protein
MSPPQFKDIYQMSEHVLKVIEFSQVTSHVNSEQESISETPPPQCLHYHFLRGPLNC